MGKRDGSWRVGRREGGGTAGYDHDQSIQKHDPP